MILNNSQKNRFFKKIITEPNTGCFLWTNAEDGCGYGWFRINGKMCRAHRISWMINKGNIPNNKLVLHKCDTPQCVNPEHLFLGSNLDNAKDKVKKNRQWKLGAPKKNKCKNDHFFSGDNLYVNDNGRRTCRACSIASSKKYRERKP